MTDVPPLAWISVSREALRHNAAAVQQHIGGVTLMAVVKANAFGHGAGETARVFQATGVNFFAVTTLDEAMELRAAGITGRILVFLPPLPDQCAVFAEYNLEATVGDAATVNALSQTGKAVAVHLKIDTGMGRIGALPENALALAQQIAATPNVEFAGIYTHFARALERDSGPTRRQFAEFQQVVATLKENGIDPGLRHVCNSAALLRFPEMRLDAVRPGTILYGQYPSANVPRTLTLQETWRMEARIVAVRDIPVGASVGYGGEWTARRASKIAVLPVGYADGFTLAPESARSGWRGVKSLLRPSRPFVTVRGRRVPVAGRVAMQTCAVDVTDIPGVAPGDIARVPARRLAANARLPRVFVERFDP